MNYVERPGFEKLIRQSLKRNPVTAILGPRQCGKTTLARVIAGKESSANWFDLEDPLDESLLTDMPKSSLQQSGLVVIDEIQRLPDLFKTLRVIVDSQKSNSRFLILGSASPDLLRTSSESLAGRIGFVDLSGFSLEEVGMGNMGKLWLRGSFPKSFLANATEESYQWRLDFIRTFLERDLRNLGINIVPSAMRRFWTMLAHFHAKVWSGAGLARSLGVSESTVRRYLDILTGAYMVRQLQPWHENLKKRQVKSPKILIRDTGLLYALLGIQNDQQLNVHPASGPSWEGFIIEQIISLAGQNFDFYFWNTHSGAELDLLFFKNGSRIGFEIKRTEKPKISRSMRIALNDLHLDKLYLVYPGNRRLMAEEKIEFFPAAMLDAIF